MDFADRQLHFVASDHWSWRIPVRITITTIAATAPLPIGATVAWWLITNIGTAGLFAMIFLVSTGLIALAIGRTARP